MAGSNRRAMQEPIFSAGASDARADRGRREIAISPEQVTIRRRIKGIDMRLSLSVASYRGVALCLRPGAGDTLVYQLLLLHRDADLSVVLDEAVHDRDIIADWRLWARVLALPALVERQLGVYEIAEANVAVAAPAAPRRKRPLKRRPRFLARRRVGVKSAETSVHRDEREIIART